MPTGSGVSWRRRDGALRRDRWKGQAAQVTISASPVKPLPAGETGRGSFRRISPTRCESRTNSTADRQPERRSGPWLRPGSGQKVGAGGGGQPHSRLAERRRTAHRRETASDASTGGDPGGVVHGRVHRRSLLSQFSPRAAHATRTSSRTSARRAGPARTDPPATVVLIILLATRRA